jgi:hypothetical protein
MAVANHGVIFDGYGQKVFSVMKTGWFDELVLKHEPHLGVWRGAQVRQRKQQSGFYLFVFIWL